MKSWEEANTMLKSDNSEKRLAAHNLFDCKYFQCLCYDCDHVALCRKKGTTIMQCNFYQKLRG